jgi:hypothetical protein
MIYQGDANSNNPDGLAYDLRQRYAIQLGDLRARILEARSQRDYISWYDLLDCLYVEIASKLKPEEKKEYNEKIKIANKIIKANWNAMNNKKYNGVDIYSTLREINLWLNNKMDENDMFGASESGEYGGL